MGRMPRARRLGPLASLAAIAVLAVAGKRNELGQQAVRLLLRRLHNPDAEPQHITLPTGLIIRKSCGATLQKGT